MMNAYRRWRLTRLRAALAGQVAVNRACDVPDHRAAGDVIRASAWHEALLTESVPMPRAVASHRETE